MSVRVMAWLAEVEDVDGVAELSGDGMVNYLTDYSTRTAANLFELWSGLDRYLLVKYMDGNVKKEDANGFLDNGNGKNIPAMPDFPGYDERWKRNVAAGDDGTLLVPQKK